VLNRASRSLVLHMFLPENCKLRAIDDFDPGQMNGREELELRDILATDTGIKRQNDPYTVALTFKRGDRIEKIPCNNVR